MQAYSALGFFPRDAFTPAEVRLLGAAFFWDKYTCRRCCATNASKRRRS